MLKDELRDAEKRENDLSSEMIQERSEIADLELEIQHLGTDVAVLRTSN